MIPAILAPILSALASKGMGLLAGAIEAKGKEVIESKLGVKIPSSVEELTPELSVKLKTAMMEHEEFLIDAQVKQAEINLKLESVAQESVTKRWEADMLSDSWLSKNIRPLALIHTLLLLDLMVVLAFFKITIPDGYLSLIAQLLMLMVGAYFVGRTVEKGVDVYQGWKQTKGD